MTLISDETRAKYKALYAEAGAALEAAKPARVAYDEAMKPYRELTEQMEELALGDVQPCEGCDDFIFEGDKRSSTVEGSLCAKCSPSYADMLAHPELFMSPDDDDELMTAAEAQRICDAHVAAGGSLEDSMAS